MRGWGAAVALATAVVAGCADDGAALLVRCLSERAIPGEAERLELDVIDPGDGASLSRQVFDLAPIGVFPATIGVEKGEETPDVVRIEARVLVGEVVVAAGAVETAFQAGANRQVDITLVDSP